MKANYEYPLELDWTTNEKIAVTTFLQMVEEAYEHGVNRDNLLAAYNAFKKVVPDKAGERRIDREFEAVADYSTYRAVQAARQTDGHTVRLHVDRRRS